MIFALRAKLPRGAVRSHSQAFIWSGYLTSQQPLSCDYTTRLLTKKCIVLQGLPSLVHQSMVAAVTETSLSRERS